MRLRILTALVTKEIEENIIAKGRGEKSVKVQSLFGFFPLCVVNAKVL